MFETYIFRLHAIPIGTTGPRTGNGKKGARSAKVARKSPRKDSTHLNERIGLKSTVELLAAGLLETSLSAVSGAHNKTCGCRNAGASDTAA